MCEYVQGFNVDVVSASAAAESNLWMGRICITSCSGVHN